MDLSFPGAAAIAYAREGADVAISYYPTEEPHAREVTQLIEVAGRKAIPIPRDLRSMQAIPLETYMGRVVVWPSRRP
jgi:NAD(P)-dependent dehydrogenase (short-subunit alcohol dehydrogenase family)